MSVYDRSWERDDARRRERAPGPPRSESDIERWARTATPAAQGPLRRTAVARPEPDLEPDREPESGAAMPALLVGLGLVAAALLLFVLVLFVSGALTITYIPAH